MPKPFSITLRTVAAFCTAFLLIGCQSQKSATSTTATEVPAEKPAGTQSAPPAVTLPTTGVMAPTNVTFRVKAGAVCAVQEFRRQRVAAGPGF